MHMQSDHAMCNNILHNRVKLFLQHCPVKVGWTHLHPYEATLSIELSNIVHKCCWDDTIKHSVSVSAGYHSIISPKRFWWC